MYVESKFKYALSMHFGEFYLRKVSRHDLEFEAKQAPEGGRRELRQ
jgi:hypothetical protein